MLKKVEKANQIQALKRPQTSFKLSPPWPLLWYNLRIHTHHLKICIIFLCWWLSYLRFYHNVSIYRSNHRSILCFYVLNRTRAGPYKYTTFHVYLLIDLLSDVRISYFQYRWCRCSRSHQGDEENSRRKYRIVYTFSLQKENKFKSVWDKPKTSQWQL